MSLNPVNHGRPSVPLDQALIVAEAIGRTA